MKFCSTKTRTYKSSQQSAFTLLELLVSLSILAFVAAMSVTSYPRFSEQIGVSGEAYKMLAFMRESQVYGTAAVTIPGTKSVYGFLINRDNGWVRKVIIENPRPNDRTNQYYVYANIADSSAEEFSVKRQFEIESICPDENCTNDYDQAYVFFRRPNPEGRIIGLNQTLINPNVGEGTLDKLEVNLASKRNPALKKKLVILSTGQMYVSDW